MGNNLNQVQRKGKWVSPDQVQIVATLITMEAGLAEEWLRWQNGLTASTLN